MAQGRGVWCKVEGCGTRKRGVVQGKGGVAQGRGVWYKVEGVGQGRGVWHKVGGCGARGMGGQYSHCSYCTVQCHCCIYVQFKHACSIAQDSGTQSTLMNAW